MGERESERERRENYSSEQNLCSWEILSSLARRIIFFSKKETHLRLTLLLCCYAGSNVAFRSSFHQKYNTHFHSHSCLGRSSKNNYVRASCWILIFSENLFFMPLRGWSEEEKRKKCSGSAVKF